MDLVLLNRQPMHGDSPFLSVPRAREGRMVQAPGKVHGEITHATGAGKLAIEPRDPQ